MNKGSHPNNSGSHQKKKYRIDCEVSEEVFKMWKEITKADQKKSKKRYYPAHSLSRLIEAEHRILKAFGSQ